MSKLLVGIVVSHGSLAAGLVDAVGAITGVGEGLIPVSNEGCDAAALRDRISRSINGREAVVFLDLPAGSCLVAAARALHDCDNVALVAGVNLAMLLDFVFHRDLPSASAAARAVEVGIRAISQPSP